MAEGSRGLGHLVTPDDWLVRIAHDPQHVCERQLAGCGCFLPHLLVGAAGRSLGASSGRPFSPVSVQRGMVRFSLIKRSTIRLKENLLVFLPPRPFHEGCGRGQNGVDYVNTFRLSIE